MRYSERGKVEKNSRSSEIIFEAEQQKNHVKWGNVKAVKFIKVLSEQ